VKSDILVTFNVPVAVSSSSSSAAVASNITSTDENVAIINGLLRSFAIKNWGLFSGSNDGEEKPNAAPNDVEMGT